MSLHAPRKALLYGFLIWLIPFVVAVFIFKLRENYRPLFESIMCVTVAAATSWLGVLYFRRVQSNFCREGITVGLLWFAISIAIDLPLFSAGPMKTSLANYMMDIGLTYLLIPAVTIGFGCLLEKRQSTKPAA